MKDFLEREIKVGCTLVYPVRRKSKMWLTKIQVTDLGDETIRGVNDKGHRVTLSRSNRSIVVTLLCEYCGHDPTSSEG